MINNEFITVDAIISDFIDDTGLTQTETMENLLKKWAKDEISRLEVAEDLCHEIAYLPIKGYKAEYPDNIRIICEVAYRKKKANKDDCKVVGHRIVQWAQQTVEGCELEINLKCPRCHKHECNCHSEGIVVDVDEIWRQAHPEVYQSGYVKVGRFGYGVSRHTDEFRLMGCTDNPWHGVRHLPDCANLHCRECEHKYSAEKGFLDTTLKEGFILLSYLGARTDEGGDIMVDISNKHVLMAIVEYLKYKWFYRQYTMKGDNHSKSLYSEAFQLNEEYAARAMSENSIPPAQEFMKYWAKSKFSKMENAYCNLINGKSNIAKLGNRNPYNS